MRRAIFGCLTLLLISRPAWADPLRIVSGNQTFLDSVRITTSERVVLDNGFEGGVWPWYNVPFSGGLCQNNNRPELGCFGPTITTEYAHDGSVSATAFGSFQLEILFDAVGTNALTTLQVYERFPDFPGGGLLCACGQFLLNDGTAPYFGGSELAFHTGEWQLFDLLPYAPQNSTLIGMRLFTSDPEIAIPEPATWLLLLLGGCGVCVLHRRLRVEPEPINRR